MARNARQSPSVLTAVFAAHSNHWGISPGTSARISDRNRPFFFFFPFLLLLLVCNTNSPAFVFVFFSVLSCTAFPRSLNFLAGKRGLQCVTVTASVHVVHSDCLDLCCFVVVSCGFEPSQSQRITSELRLMLPCSKGIYVIKQMCQKNKYDNN